jgi:hypothetical protein
MISVVELMQSRKDSGKQPESIFKRIIPGDNPGITILVLKELY